MTRARIPRPHEVAAASRDQRLLRAIRERRPDAAWRARGACRDADPETFFPDPAGPADAAVAFCKNCPVAGACLAWALEAGDCHGVWGATTARERRPMLVAWRAERRELAHPTGAVSHLVGHWLPGSSSPGSSSVVG
jgi:WhiB family transcriptional regulator, redox-sensing transcriptional regulator